jgi:hypothetical protein
VKVSLFPLAVIVKRKTVANKGGIKAKTAAGTTENLKRILTVMDKPSPQTYAINRMLAVQINKQRYFNERNKLGMSDEEIIKAIKEDEAKNDLGKEVVARLERNVKSVMELADKFRQEDYDTEASGNVRERPKASGGVSLMPVVGGIAVFFACRYFYSELPVVFPIVACVAAGYGWTWYAKNFS